MAVKGVEASGNGIHAAAAQVMPGAQGALPGVLRHETEMELAHCESLS